MANVNQCDRCGNVNKCDETFYVQIYHNNCNNKLDYEIHVGDLCPACKDKLLKFLNVKEDK